MASKKLEKIVINERERRIEVTHTLGSAQTTDYFKFHSLPMIIGGVKEAPLLISGDIRLTCQQEVELKDGSYSINIVFQRV